MKFIAVAGKGGTGKTTLTSLIIRNLQLKNIKPILAIDADPNSNLNELLGIEYKTTISDIKEEILDKKEDIPGKMSKGQYLEYRINQVVVENKDLDLLVMGRPEGPKCYCYVNNLLREYLDVLSKHYFYVVIDTEAGMEHLSRKTTHKIDFLFIITENTNIGIKSALRIYDLATQLNLEIKNIYFVLNKITFPLKLYSQVEFIGAVPFDSQIKELEKENKPLLLLTNSSALKSIEEIMKKVKMF